MSLAKNYSHDKESKTMSEVASGMTQITKDVVEANSKLVKYNEDLRALQKAYQEAQTPVAKAAVAEKMAAKIAEFNGGN